MSVTNWGCFFTVRASLQRGPRGLVNASVSDGLTALHQVNLQLDYTDKWALDYAIVERCSNNICMSLHTRYNTFTSCTVSMPTAGVTNDQ